MRIEVLGPIRLRDDDQNVVEVPERKVRALLAALVAAEGETVPAHTLIDRVWGEALPANPARVLHAKLSQLRTLLDEASAGARQMLIRAPGGYSLRVTAETLDAADFRARIRAASVLSPHQERAALLAAALKLWRGAPYAEFADELWLTAESAELQEARLRAVELSIEALLQVGTPEQALSLGVPHLAEHPTREMLAAKIMLAYYRSRRQPDALATYERLRGHLADQYGVEPSPELRELHMKILRQDASLEGVTPESHPEPDGARPLAPDQSIAVSVGAKHLPSYASPFLGRAEEVHQVTQLLTEHRLVTLLGIGGTGKTRLAVRVAEFVTTDGHGAAWFVDLAAIPQHRTETEGEPGNRIARAVAEALQLSAPRQDSGDLTERIAMALGAGETLLVIDNCEHVIDEVSHLANQLLTLVPDVRILATSREPMALPEEQRYMVPLLPVDGGANPAVDFFMARAKAVNPHLSADHDSLQAAAELCRKLDGLPLALELAAARTSALSIPELLARITDRLDLLARPGRATPRRQQTLRGMLDWSWSLLDDQERILLRRISVHPVTWSLDVLEQVCADSESPPVLTRRHCPSGESTPKPAGVNDTLPRGRVFSALANLVERSLVSTVTIGGETRYRLLETVGTYASEKLAESGEREAVALRHMSYYRRFADCARGFLFGPHARDWLRCLGDARSHLSHALREALRREDGPAAVALVLDTFWYRWMTGHIDSLVDELHTVVDRVKPGGSPAEQRAHAQVTVLATVLVDQHSAAQVERVLASLEGFDTDEQGQLARMQVQWFAATVLLTDENHRDRGEQLADAAIHHLLDAGDLAGAAFASTQRDWFLLDHWDVVPKGLPDGYDAESILRDHGDAYGLTQVLAVEHLLAETQGRTERALALTDEAADLCVDLGLNIEVAYWRTVQAINALCTGDLGSAESHLDRARELAQRTAFVFDSASMETMTAIMAHRRGETERAADLLAALSAEDQTVASRQLARFLGEASLPPGLHLSRA